MTAVSIAWADLAARFLPLGVVLIVVAAGLAAIRYVGGRTLRDIADDLAEIIGR